MKYLPALITAIMWGICYTSTSQIVKNISIKLYIVISCMFTSILFIALILLDNKKQSFDYNSIGWVITSCVTSCIATYMSISAVKECGASTAAFIEVSYPMWIILFSSLIGVNSGITINTLVGGILICIGTSIIIWK